MRFFLPEFVVAAQGGDPVAATRWDETARLYKIHLEAVRQHLPAAAAEFTRWSLHDGRIRDLTKEEPLSMELDLSTGLDPNHIGYHQVHFVGCRHTSGLDNLLNQWIIADEFHTSPENLVHVQFLTDKGEAEVTCQDILARTVPYGKRLSPDGIIADDANEQDVLKRISALKTAGVFPSEIIKSLNDAGRLTRYGNAWTIKDLKVAIAALDPNLSVTLRGFTQNSDP